VNGEVNPTAEVAYTLSSGALTVSKSIATTGLTKLLLIMTAIISTLFALLAIIAGTLKIIGRIKNWVRTLRLYILLYPIPPVRLLLKNLLQERLQVTKNENQETPQIPKFYSETLSNKPLPPNITAHVYFDKNYEGGSTRRILLDTPTLRSKYTPNAITSEMLGLNGYRQNPYDRDDVYHRPILDIDFPAMLIPSSTEGHYHLYLDLPMKWSAYEKLLSALAAAGIIEKGYYRASVERKATFLRLPGVPKDDPNSP
jgi:hypothetical protein